MGVDWRGLMHHPWHLSGLEVIDTNDPGPDLNHRGFDRDCYRAKKLNLDQCCWSADDLDPRTRVHTSPQGPRIEIDSFRCSVYCPVASSLSLSLSLSTALFVEFLRCEVACIVSLWFRVTCIACVTYYLSQPLWARTVCSQCRSFESGWSIFDPKLTTSLLWSGIAFTNLFRWRSWI